MVWRGGIVFLRFLILDYIQRNYGLSIFFQYLSIFMLSFQTVVKMFTTLDNIIYYYYNSDQCPFKYIFLYFCNAYLYRVISISLINHHDFLCRRYSINNT